tara:strand:- start:1767 stop:2729 length:963 start_codon:yes stop_codon:yes gene_type:complete
MNEKYIIYFILVIIILINLFQEPMVIEPMIFDSSAMKRSYKKYGIDIDERNETLTKGNKLINYSTHLNKKNVTNNKISTSQKIISAGLPAPAYYEWNNELNLNNNLQKINNLSFPLVVKWANGEKGGDVFTDITNNDELLDHIKSLQNQNKFPILIEEQIKGEKYRIMVLNDHVIFISHHSVPKIIGDGKTTIRKLIENYSTGGVVKPIKIINKNLIRQQGYALDDVLEKNKEIFVTKVISTINGSKETFIKERDVHPENMMLFKKINKLFGINFSGIDYVTPDISRPYIGKVIEVNDGPGFSLNQQKHYIKKWIAAIFN